MTWKTSHKTTWQEGMTCTDKLIGVTATTPTGISVTMENEKACTLKQGTTQARTKQTSYKATKTPWINWKLKAKIQLTRWLP